MDVNGYEIKPGANLNYANLRDANLCGANLYKENLRGADLCGADLCGANLYKANLRGADLCGADLHNADLRGADLRNADLCGVDLRGVDLSYAHLHTALGVIHAGFEIRGYEIIGCLTVDKKLHHIKAGCRWFTPAQALKHWSDGRSTSPAILARVKLIIELANSL